MHLSLTKSDNDKQVTHIYMFCFTTSLYVFLTNHKLMSVFAFMNKTILGSKQHGAIYLNGS